MTSDPASRPMSPFYTFNPHLVACRTATFYSRRFESFHTLPSAPSSRQTAQRLYPPYLVMILSLPQELVCMIIELCPLGSQASLSRSCRRLCEICIPILYRNDVENYRCSSVFHAIVHSRDECDALAILATARANGADFKRCQDARKYHPLSLYSLDATLHSPLRLAARRGRDDVMSFLLDHGLPPDGPGNTDTSKKTPLMEAIVSHQESTAILLVRRGASIGLRPPNLEAFKAAVRGDLACLVRVIVEQEGLDVNADVGYGCTPLVLSVCYKREQMIRTLLDMGAQAMPAMRQLCRNHAFLSILWMLGSGSMLVSEILSIDDIIELAALITTQRASPVHKDQQVLALERLLELVDKSGPWDRSSPARSARQRACFPDAPRCQDSQWGLIPATGNTELADFQ